jgi:hypothetical protein
MDTIHTDNKLRDVLYSLYVAQFKAIKAYPAGFDNNHATRMLTGLMGSRRWSWRVIGITKEALEIFGEHNFERPPRLIQRGHRQARSDTAKALYYDIANPMRQDEFFTFFLTRDETVLMTVGQNRHRPGGKFPSFIKVPLKLGLFPCGSLVGWQHRKEEVAFLRQLHAKHFS